MADRNEILVRTPEGMYSDLELVIARQVLIMFLRWLNTIRKTRIDGESCDISVKNDIMHVDYSGDEQNRPKRLRWSLTMELDNYQDGEQPPLL